jgi:aryl-alcohol dehydrogenase-like predicted oxidoreductase
MGAQQPTAEFLDQAFGRRVPLWGILDVFRALVGPVEKTHESHDDLPPETLHLRLLPDVGRCTPLAFYVTVVEWGKKNTMPTSTLPRRPLGRSGIDIPPLVFGGNVFGWTADEPTSFRLLDALLDAGLNAIDTADVYSRWVPGHTGGESETVIGNWFAARGSRDRVIVATKVGADMGNGNAGLSKSWIMRAVEDSLRRLKSDYIDLYQAHQDDQSTPLEDTLEAFATLIQQGKVRAIGASNYTAPRLKEALDVSKRRGLPRYESLQPHYNLVERKIFEDELEPLCLAEALGVISYYALAGGFLTGKYRFEADLAKSPRGQGVAKYLDDRGKRVLAALDEAAKRLAVTPAQVAIAWLIARPSVTAPIASATNIEQLHDLVNAVRLQLDADTIAALNRASA